MGQATGQFQEKKYKSRRAVGEKAFCLNKIGDSGKTKFKNKAIFLHIDGKFKDKNIVKKIKYKSKRK